MGRRGSREIKREIEVAVGGEGQGLKFRQMEMPTLQPLKERGVREARGEGRNVSC